MAPHAVTNGGSHSKRRPVTVLVTGFGPFVFCWAYCSYKKSSNTAIRFQEKFPVNPSYEITRSLPNTLAKLTADGREVQIVGYGTPIRVCYEDVRQLVPIMHESYLGTVDLILHIGMASGRDYYTAELYGHRDGYSKNKDIDGRTLPIDDGLIHFGDCPAMMTTSLDYDEVLAKWNTNLLGLPESSPAHSADCRSSEDAGHYLCDYIYYNSLAWFGRLSGKLDGGKASDRPVLFLHVPADSDLETLEKGQHVALALVEAMVDNWCSSKKNGFVRISEPGH